MKRTTIVLLALLAFSPCLRADDTNPIDLFSVDDGLITFVLPATVTTLFGTHTDGSALYEIDGFLGVKEGIAVELGLALSPLDSQFFTFDLTCFSPIVGPLCPSEEDVFLGFTTLPFSVLSVDDQTAQITFIPGTYEAGGISQSLVISEFALDTPEPGSLLLLGIGTSIVLIPRRRSATFPG